jgi:hypothetical protein
MSDSQRLENYIPLRKAELVEWLCGAGELPAGEREAFCAFCRLVGALFHHDYQARLERLKAAYHPFDPDADTRALVPVSAEDKQRRLNDLFTEVGAVLEGAGYQHLGAGELEAALHGASAWGLRMEVDFRAFERMAVFVRGRTVQKRPLRRLRKALRTEERDVPIYQRIVMALKLRKHPRIGPHIDTHCVYLQLFKNIPQLDVNMLFPGARVRMTYFDRGRVGLPLLSGLALTLWQVIRDVAGAIWHFLNDFILFKPAAVWAVATGAFGYGFRSYYNYHQTKQRYILSLLQLLYFQNLDTNAGVLYRLLDEAEEQDCREAILTYYYLWRFAGEQGWTLAELDRYVEQDLERRANVRVDFKNEACLRRVERLQVVEKRGDRYRARPLGEAIGRLEATWESCFQAHGPPPVGLRL